MNATRGSTKSTRRVRPIRVRWPVAVLILTVLLSSQLMAAGPARGADYPSWSEVEAARSSESAKATEINRITNLLRTLEDNVRTAQAAAADRGSDYEKAQVRLDLANYRAQTLRASADAAQALANASQARAGQLVAQLARFGNGDPTALLLLNGQRAETLLFRLGTMSQLTQRSNRALAAATTSANTVRSLTRQADAAQAALANLSRAAEKALQDAVAASRTAANQLAEQQQTQGTLQAQLAVLVENRKTTEADYRKGEEARRQQEAAAAAAAAAAAPVPSGGGGQLGGQGWAKPVSGWISDRFGPRPDKPVASSSAFHYGTDLAAGCGTAIFAAASGRVVYAGWLGTYGNWVLLDHGTGVMTGYAHIREGGVLVNIGQTIQAGQNIAQVGTTGGSSGCHLHFEVRVNGNRIDPQPFMSARGITLG